MTRTRRIVSEKLGLEVSQKLKNDYFKELLHKKISTFTEQKTGNLTQQLNRDIDDIATIITTELSACLRGCAFFIVGIFCILIYCSQLTIFTLLPMTLLAGVGGYHGKILKKEKAELSALNGQMNVFTQEKLMQIRTVKLFTGENVELKNFQELLEKIRSKVMVVARYTSRFYAIMEFLGENMVIWALGYGVYLMHTTPGLTIGKLTAFATYGVYTGMGFQLIASFYAEFIKAAGMYSNITKISSDTSDREEIISTPSHLHKSAKGVSIRFEAVSFTYPGRDTSVINDVSLSISSGEIWGIVGQSGSGKSTLFHLLTNLYKPDSGSIFIENSSIHDHPAWWARQFISIVSQEALLFSTTIAENIKYSWPNASFEDIKEACSRADALEFIQSLPSGFNTQVGENGFSLSGGQRQRIAIARALLKEPQVLLLDEATSGLDANSEASIQNIIEREVKKHGFTVIIITHRVNTLKNLTDYLAIMKNGRITVAGTFETVSESADFQLISRT